MKTDREIAKEAAEELHLAWADAGPYREFWKETVPDFLLQFARDLRKKHRRQQRATQGEPNV